MNIKQRAHYLLTCDELRGRVPEEVRQFLSDVVALEPVGYVANVFFPDHEYNYGSVAVDAVIWRASATSRIAIYVLGGNHDPA